MFLPSWPIMFMGIKLILQNFSISILFCLSADPSSIAAEGNGTTTVMVDQDVRHIEAQVCHIMSDILKHRYVI